MGDIGLNKASPPGSWRVSARMRRRSGRWWDPHGEHRIARDGDELGAAKSICFFNQFNLFTNQMGALEMPLGLCVANHVCRQIFLWKFERNLKLRGLQVWFQPVGFDQPGCPVAVQQDCSQIPHSKFPQTWNCGFVEFVTSMSPPPSPTPVLDLLSSPAKSSSYLSCLKQRLTRELILQSGTLYGHKIDHLFSHLS